MSGASEHTPLREDLPSLGVRRPLLTLVLNLMIVIAGIAAWLGVEVRELPDVDRPVVSVSARLPGASPETMDAEVTSILEGAVARVSGVRSISSSSEENSARIRVEFKPGTSMEEAASDVRESVNRVRRLLPTRVEQVVVTKSDSNASPIVRVAAVSDTLDTQSLTRRLENEIVPEFRAIPGVADVQLYGTRERQLRVMVDPLRMASHGLAANDVVTALRNAPFDAPAGSFRSQDQQLIVRAQARAVTPEAIEQVTVRDGVRVGDFADAAYGPADATSFIQLDGRRVTGMGIIRQAQSNTIEISQAVRHTTDRLNRGLTDIRLIVSSDDAEFIENSVREVIVSLLLAVAIVVVTIWAFLGSWRATLIPAAAIPISLIGTVAAIWALGFSINLVTLLALVLATGMIVDDAIVVLENTQRRRAQGLHARAAAVLGARQVFFAVIATTMVMVAVFVPISFLPGTAGKLFREFGFVLAIAISISSFVALSLVPALASRLLPNAREPSALRRPFVRVGEALARFYGRALDAVLGAPRTVFGVALLIALAAAWSYGTLDRELTPSEDRGMIRISASGPDGVGLDYMQKQADAIEAVLQPYLADGRIRSLFTIVGIYDPNRIWMAARLQPWDEREWSQQQLIRELRPKMARIPGANVSVYGPSGLSVGSGVATGIRAAITGPDYQRIFTVAQEFTRRVNTDLRGLSNAEQSYDPTQPQLLVDIDRERAAELGVPLDELGQALRAMIDGEELIDLSIDDQAVPLRIEARPGAISGPNDLRNIFVRARDGGLVPLSSFAQLREQGVAGELDRYGQRRAITFTADLAQGYPLQSAVDDLRALAREVLPPDTGLVLLGDAATLDEATDEINLTYAIAFVVVLLALIAQFESIASAVVVMTVVPFGIAAAIFALLISGVSINLYSQIGLVMLIGLMAKNGILMVEFADQLRSQGLKVREAITHAARVRLRPIAMTMFSTVVGGLPLVLASGAGAEARIAIGWVAFGGLALAAVFTLFLTPVVYLGLARFAKPRSDEGRRLVEEMRHAQGVPDLGEGADVPGVAQRSAGTAR